MIILLVMCNWCLNYLSNSEYRDFSETAITHLPTVGLEHLEMLRLTNTFTLKIIPSIYDLKVCFGNYYIFFLNGGLEL